MANDYENLGTIFQSRGNVMKALKMYKRAIELYDQIGSPNSEDVQKLLDELNN
ncbi:MAG: tetratricopeptide repeat protein [Candidatus Dadabacteria bacterium]|nr:tetratricopeptide repeat protein [Candidatus Dadabacteria bacterium]NIS08687.1 tetratricopeptide repeat protein [Candidatus Dadabacteria bacterium]NIY23034.1 hypothetical protein [Candidatus Dadabacteria bacterium]